jgi:PAS domain S-box-containing protein
MATDLNGILTQAELRARAVKRLTGTNGSRDSRLKTSAAFQVLHDLASSPSTAAAAMALLHELQVHQVEVDLQDEELRRSRAELESTLVRQVQLYDFAPVGCLTVDKSTVVRELNLTAARMLGCERDQLLGRNLDAFLTPQSARALQAMLTRVVHGASTVAAELQLVAGRRTPRGMHASASRDPDGQHFLIALIELAEHRETPAP